MHSCLYRGTLRHRRFSPAGHEFTHRVSMAYLDLAELDAVFRGRWLWSVDRRTPVAFRRRDHLGDPARPLDACVRELVAERTGVRPAGAIRLLTNLSHFGYCFNPVSFYHVFDATGRDVETIVAEVNNTPWGERHCYVLPAPESSASGRRRRHHRFPKAFHVSPFLPMDMEYDWSFVLPGRHLAVHMENRRGGVKVLDATLVLRRREISGWALALSLARFPLMPLKVIAAIHWHALRLWLKGCPVHPHPKHLTPTETRRP